MLTGVPSYVDGSGLQVAEAAGARIVNRDRMWHYTEGIKNWDPVWPGHGIRILPGPSSLWLDALGRRMEAPCLPGHDTMGTLQHLRTDPGIDSYDHSWFILNQRIIAKEFALSGSEQNPDLTSGDQRRVVMDRLFARGAPAPIQAFLEHGEDFIVARTLEQLVEDEPAGTANPHRPCTCAPASGSPGSADTQSLRQGSADPEHPQRTPLPRGSGNPRREGAPDLGPQGRSTNRRAASSHHPQNPGWDPN